MEKKQSLKNTIWEYVKVVLVTVILTYSLLFFVQVSRVVGHSMDPTYHNGEVVLVNKRFYKLSDVKYGDVVVAEVNFGDGDEQIIKRVIGKPGDTISCKDGVMYRNGKKLDESYIMEDMAKESWNYHVAEGKLFVMGDNRNNSSDSRVLGALDFQQHIVGKVFFHLFQSVGLHSFLIEYYLFFQIFERYIGYL